MPAAGCSSRALWKAPNFESFALLLNEASRLSLSRCLVIGDLLIDFRVTQVIDQFVNPG
jgi:hypothetical protein